MTAAGTLNPTGIAVPTDSELLPNSVTAHNGVVAVAYAVRNTATGAQGIGKAAFFTASTGAYISAVDVGYLPDMLTFTPDGLKIVVANEGEPNSYGQADSFDPEGSVSIIDMANGPTNATVQTATFTAFNGQIDALRAAGVRIFGPGATVAQDLEPEYVALSADGQTAYVTLQENNALARVDLATATVTDILPLGYKDHSLTGNGLDASDRDVDGSSGAGGKINIQNWPVFGMYMPDSIASYSVGNNTYLVTANEGDARDYPGFAEEVRLGDSSYVLDPTAFPNAAELKNNINLGRLTVTNTLGDTNNDGNFEQIYAFGARSFSVWDGATGALVFDSGDQLERLTALQVPGVFNGGGAIANNELDGRSDNKGPEPEGVDVGRVGERVFAFIGLERVGDVVAYDVTNPQAPVLLEYLNGPADIAPEGVLWVGAANSPTGKDLVILASEKSNTLTVYEFTPNYPAACDTTGGVTCIHSIQGSGNEAAITGTVTVSGLVVGDFQEENGGIRGFYVQEEDDQQDGDILTSEGIFVFCGTNCPAVPVAVGDQVTVTGTAAEFQGQTQIGGTLTVTVNRSGNALPTAMMVPMPFPAAVNGVEYLERLEGMRVSFPQTLYVTEHFQLGRFGQVVLSSEDRLYQPTQIVPPGSEAQEIQTSNDLNKIILDDANNLQNADPILFGRGGNPLSASNTLRGGDTVQNLDGVLVYSWAGNNASPNAYRVRVNQSPNFVAANPRPSNPPSVGNATLKIATFNVLNYFNTFDNADSAGCFPRGVRGDCRGADSEAEFIRQSQKIVAAIQKLDADLIGLNELENDGFGPESAIQDLVNRLNTAMGANTYAFVNANVSNVGTDAITVGFLYKPAVLEIAPNTTVATLDTGVFAPGVARHRVPIAATFRHRATDQIFTAATVHFKSKSRPSSTDSAAVCLDNDASNDIPDCDQGDGQGFFNATRTLASNELRTWLASNPTGTNDPDVVILGDFNAYAMEDPIMAFTSAGYSNLILGYSYVFGGQWGSLDHIIANASMAAQFIQGGKYHINADEPPVLDYNLEFKSPNQQTSLFAADEFRSSDHDPVLAGFFRAVTADNGLDEAFANLPPTEHQIRIVNNGIAVNETVTIPVTRAISLVGGPINLAAGTNLNFTVAPNAVLTVDIEIIGGGTITVTGGGILEVNRVLTANVVVNNGRVRGVGQIVGNVTIGTTDGATIAAAPGNTVGSFRVRDLTLGNFGQVVLKFRDLAAALAVGQSTTGLANDQLIVDNRIELGNSRLSLDLLDFRPHGTQTFTLIDNRGSEAVNGTFRDLPEGSRLRLGTDEFVISYRGGDGNDITLTTFVPSYLQGIAARAFVGQSDAALIVGVALEGNGEKSLRVRVSGSSLAAAGINSVLQNAQLQLFRVGNNTPIRTDVGPNFEFVQAATAGNYTAVLSGADGAVGVAILEVYDNEPMNQNVRLQGLSARGFAGNGENILIGGVAVVGNTDIPVRITARGPSLLNVDPPVIGALPDPFLQLYQLTPTTANLLDSNDNAASGNSLLPTESLLEARLRRGNFTANVSAATPQLGITLLEIYAAPRP